MKETIVAQRKASKERLKVFKLAEILDNIMDSIVRAKILNITEHRGLRPQSHGLVERFHRTVLDEFCRIVFHPNLFEELQKDLGTCLHEYNYA